MLKEIKITELSNPISLFEKGAIALATSLDHKTNGLTIGWGSIGILWSKPCCTVYIHKDRYSKQIFDSSDYFAVCFVDNQKELEFFGTKSGRDIDKIKASFHFFNSTFI